MVNMNTARGSISGRQGKSSQLPVVGEQLPVVGYQREKQMFF